MKGLVRLAAGARLMLDGRSGRLRNAIRSPGG
jgi:hypothetical protein